MSVQAVEQELVGVYDLGDLRELERVLSVLVKKEERLFQQPDFLGEDLYDVHEILISQYRVVNRSGDFSEYISIVPRKLDKDPRGRKTLGKPFLEYSWHIDSGSSLSGKWIKKFTYRGNGLNRKMLEAMAEIPENFLRTMQVMGSSE